MDPETRLRERLLAIPDLVALVGQRVRGIAMHGRDPRPAITYRRLKTDFDGVAGGWPGQGTAYVELTAWSGDYDEAKRIALLIHGRQELDAGGQPGPSTGLSGWRDKTGTPAINMCKPLDEADVVLAPEPGQDTLVYGVEISFRVEFCY